MFAVLVTFTIKEGRIKDFLPLIKANAAQSLKAEPGCHVFEICRDDQDIVLYEVYDDRAAFDAHLASDHFLTFDAQIADMVLDKHIRLFSEVYR